MTAVLDRPAQLGMISSGRRLKNHLATVLASASFLIALVPLGWLLWTVISKGLHTITRSGWFTHSQRNADTQTSAGGGAYHAIIGTAEQVGLCTLVAVPIAILTAVYLVEYGRGRFAKATTFMVDILTGIPSIVAAVFIYAVFIGTLHEKDKAGWLVSLALVLLMIPVIVRTTEEMLKLVPNELREASYALGIPKWKTIIRVVLPTALTGILTGVMLGVARVAGETAPLLVLSIYTSSNNADLFHGPQAALPTMINYNAGQYTASGKVFDSTNFANGKVWGTALTLVLIVMLLNLVARLIGRVNKVAE